MATTVPLLGAIYMKLRTGHGPETMEDYIFPRNGELDEDGQEQRVSIPSYVPQMYHLGNAPARTLANKSGPLPNMMYRMWTNKDYFGTEIRHPGDPALSQAGDVAKEIGKEAMPFGIHNAMKQRKLEASTQSQIEPFVGIVPAPAIFNQSEAVRTAHEINARKTPAAARTKEEFDRSQLRREEQRAEAMEEGIPEGVQGALNEGKISPKQVGAAAKRGHLTPLQRSIEHMSLMETMQVWPKADDKEREQMLPFISRKANTFLDLPGQQQQMLMPLLRQVQQWNDRRSGPQTGPPPLPPQ